MSKIQKNIFLNMKTSKIKSEKNIYQTIHSTSFIFNFFGILTIFLDFSRFFWKFKFYFLKKFKLCSVALAHHPMQYLGELLFFHTPLYIRGVWKNINSPKYYIGWCARATEQSCNFFRKWNLNFQKIGKNTKKIVKIPKKLKMKLVLCIVWYIFFSDFIFDVFMFKKIFFWILLNF